MRIKLFAMDVDGTMTDGRFTVDENGYETKTFNVKDGMAISILKKYNIKTAILTNHKSDVVKNRANQLGVDFYFDCSKNKVQVANDLLNKLNISFDEIAYIGDDINDLELLKIVGYSGCPSDAINCVKSCCKYISQYAGGYGAIRDFVEHLMNDYK